MPLLPPRRRGRRGDVGYPVPVAKGFGVGAHRIVARRCRNGNDRAAVWSAGPVDASGGGGRGENRSAITCRRGRRSSGPPTGSTDPRATVEDRVHLPADTVLRGAPGA